VYVALNYIHNFWGRARFLNKRKNLIYKEDLEIYQIESDDDIEGDIDMDYLL